MDVSRPYYRSMAVLNLTAAPGERAGWILSGNWALPSQIRVHCDVDGFTIVALILVGGSGPKLAELFIGQPLLFQGAPVTQNLLRKLTIDQIVREASALVRLPAEIVDAGRGWFRIEGEDGIFGGPQIREGRGRMTGADQLQHVAELYEQAVTEGMPPVKAVAEQLPCSRSHAGRLVGQARVAGLLSATTPGQPSSVAPARLELLSEHAAGRFPRMT